MPECLLPQGDLHCDASPAFVPSIALIEGKIYRKIGTMKTCKNILSLFPCQHHFCLNVNLDCLDVPRVTGVVDVLVTEFRSSLIEHGAWQMCGLGAISLFGLIGRIFRLDLTG